MRVSEPYTIFPRTMSNGKVVYYYQYRLENGKRSTAKSTGCTNLAQAKRFCNSLFNAGEFKKTSTLRFEVFTKDFFSHDGEFYRWKKINNSNISEETLLAYDKFLRNQLLPFFANYQLTSITRSAVKQWIIWGSEKWSPKTINNAQTVLNTILNQAVDKNIIEYNPANNLTFRTVNKKERVILTVDELNKMYHSDKWTDELARKAFLVASVTGMRISEIVALRNEDIFSNYINVQHSYSRQFGLGNTKTKRSRIVPKPEELVLHAEKYWIFETAKGTPLNITKVHDNILKVCTSLNIDYKTRGITTHTLRSFFNTYLRKENVPDAKIKAVLGHRDKEDMTDWYTYWKPEMFPEVYIAQKKLYELITGEINGY